MSNVVKSLYWWVGVIILALVNVALDVSWLVLIFDSAVYGFLTGQFGFFAFPFMNKWASQR